MKTYVKSLAIDGTRQLVSCHGGSLTWQRDTVHVPKEAPAELCAPGLIHACRMRDVPNWVGTHLVIIETSGPVIEGPDKVGLVNARIVRTTNEVDGLDVVVRFAEYVLDHDRAACLEWLVRQYPAGYFDGVEP